MVKPLVFNDLQFRGGGHLLLCVFVATAVLVVRIVVFVKAVADSVSAVAISEPIDFVKLYFM
jgi:hypothetical protein